MKKIYIASSWKSKIYVEALASFLREEGYEVDCFTGYGHDFRRYVFDWREIITDKNKLDAKSFLEDERAQKAFREDKKWLDWADIIILLLPSGNSSHLEAGYGKGQGKKLFIYAPNGFQKGEFDVMYGFADGLTDDIGELIKLIKKTKI